MSLMKTLPRGTVSRLRRPVAFVGATALLVAGVLAASAPRFHIGLASSSPAKDSHVTTAPSEIRLTFTGRIDVAKAGVDLVAADGKMIATDSLRAVVDSPKVAVAKVTGSMA